MLFFEFKLPPNIAFFSLNLDSLKLDGLGKVLVGIFKAFFRNTKFFQVLGKLVNLVDDFGMHFLFFLLLGLHCLAKILSESESVLHMKLLLCCV